MHPRELVGGRDCQTVGSWRIDDIVAKTFLEAAAPANVEVAIRAEEVLRQQRADHARLWDLQVEKARYEAERAERQYHAVEPENRLVARSLERCWNERLEALETVRVQAAAASRESPQHSESTKLIPLDHLPLPRVEGIHRTLGGAHRLVRQSLIQMTANELAPIVKSELTDPAGLTYCWVDWGDKRRWALTIRSCRKIAAMALCRALKTVKGWKQKRPFNGDEINLSRLMGPKPPWEEDGDVWAVIVAPVIHLDSCRYQLRYAE